MKVLGIIPARGGSKRIPNKNIALLAGKPLIAYTCEAAIESSLFDRIYVNTDSPRIRDIAAEYGVSAPILRPPALAQDDTSTALAVRFFLSYLIEQGESYDAVILLQPTSPLRTAGDIRCAFDLYEQNAPCGVVSATHLAPAEWLGTCTKDGRFEALPGVEPLFRLNGAIYVHSFEDYQRDLRPAKTMLYPMPPERSVDIDTPSDWRYAEYLLHQQNPVIYDPV